MALPKLKITGVTVVEGKSGTSNAEVVVSLPVPATKVVTVNYATVNGSAVAGNDFNAADGVLTFAIGEISKTILIPIIGDALKEANEKFTVLLSSPTNAALSTAKSAVVIITNDDGANVVFNGWDTPITEDADNVTTTTDNDRIKALGGDDYIDGNDGRDSLSGGSGNDTLLGSAGIDTLSGGNGIDSLNGGDGTDLLSGDAGNDELYGGIDSDTLSGGTNDDTLYGEVGNDVLNGDSGNDTLDGGSENDTLNGGVGDDILYANRGLDSLNGGEGNDYLNGSDNYYSTGNTLDGGAGNDIIHSRFGDLLLGSGGDDKLGYYLTSTDGIHLTTEPYQSGYGNDTLQGGTGNDLLAGGDGDDVFAFAVGDSGVGIGNRDIITDFYATSTLEMIDLSALSAAKLTFKGTAKIDGINQVHYAPDFVNKTTVIQINLSGDVNPEMEIQLTGIIGLSTSDFVL